MLRIRTALNPVVILVCSALPFSASALQADHAPTPFDVELLLSPQAAARFTSPQERIVVKATWWGYPAPGAENQALSSGGRIFIDGEDVEVPEGARVAHISGRNPFSPNFAYVQGPVLIYVVAQSFHAEPHSGRSGIADNMLKCNIFEAKSAEVAHTPVRLNCALTTESAGAPTHSELPSNEAANTYAIYAMLLPGASGDTIAHAPTRDWVVADTTVSIADMNPAVPPNGQLKPPPNNVQAFNEAVHDYDARRYERFHLDAKSFPHRVTLADEQQVADIRRSGSANTGIVFFSPVFFNANRTAALVYVNNWCANMCAAGQWVYLEKQNGQWVRRSGA